jgi:type IV pilus assembly protein PilE
MKMHIKNQGMTMIEILIALVVIGIIVAVGYPSFRAASYKSKRSDAINTLINLQAAEEKYRASNTSYGTATQVWGSTNTTPQGYYTVTISNVGATTYTITATATGTQANDTDCMSITLTKSGTSVSQTPATCWQ